MLKVSDDTIVEAIEKGQLKPLKIGVQWRIDREQLIDYLAIITASKNRKATAKAYLLSDLFFFKLLKLMR